MKKLESFWKILRIVIDSNAMQATFNKNKTEMLKILW